MAIRFEEKYICSEGELMIAASKASALLKRDVFGVLGKYTVRSVYFDGPDAPCLSENEDGTDPRSKYRLRLYNGNTEFIRMEIKRRRGAASEKLSVPVEKELARALLSGNVYPEANLPAPVLELALKIRTEGFRPSVVCEYTREAFCGEPGRVRVTLDRNLRAAMDSGRFFDRDIKHAVPVFPAGTGLLEVKYTALLPGWISETVLSERMHRTAFSKYRMCRIDTMTYSEAEEICLTR